MKLKKFMPVICFTAMVSVLILTSCAGYEMNLDQTNSITTNLTTFSISQPTNNSILTTPNMNFLSAYIDPAGGLSDVYIYLSNQSGTVINYPTSVALKKFGTFHTSIVLPAPNTGYYIWVLSTNIAGIESTSQIVNVFYSGGTSSSSIQSLSSAESSISDSSSSSFSSGFQSSSVIIISSSTSTSKNSESSAAISNISSSSANLSNISSSRNSESSASSLSDNSSSRNSESSAASLSNISSSRSSESSASSLSDNSSSSTNVSSSSKSSAGSLSSSSSGSSSSQGEFTGKGYYTNPTFGKYKTGGIVIDGANTANEWSDDCIIALDIVNDDGRIWGCWMMHECPVIDFSHLYAAWDDNNLYIAYQTIDPTKEIDPVNFGSRAWNSADGSGILGMIAIDTLTGQGATNMLWGIINSFTGVDKPDYKILFHGDFSQDKAFAKAVNGSFNYTPAGSVFWQQYSNVGIDGKVGNTCISTSAWGVEDNLSNRNDSKKLVDYIAGFQRNGSPAKHTDFKNDCFYEFKIPFTAIGITKAQLESTGVGVFVGTGGRNDTIPHDESTLNTPGSLNGNAELLENGKDGGDKYTAPFARIGHAK